MKTFFIEKLLGPIIVAAIFGLAAWIWGAISPGFFPRLFDCVPRAEFDALKEEVTTKVVHQNTPIQIYQDGTKDQVMSRRKPGLDDVAVKRKDDPEYISQRWSIKAP